MSMNPSWQRKVAVAAVLVSLVGLSGLAGCDSGNTPQAGAIKADQSVRPGQDNGAKAAKAKPGMERRSIKDHTPPTK